MLAAPITTGWSWRHRFYAFLLRRALGPFLTPRSAADLHRSIQAIDWTEGTLALVDVELDPEYLTTLLQGSKNEEGRGSSDSEQQQDAASLSGGGAAKNVAVYEARIRRFAIRLSVCDVDSQNKNNSGSESSATSTARKATSAFLQSMFGTNDATVDNNDDDNEGDGSNGNAAGIALVAHVELEGLDIVLAPGRRDHAANDNNSEETEWSTTTQQNNQSREQDASPSSAPGFFSTLVDSAMKSLRLSIDVSDVNIRAYSRYCNYATNNSDDDAAIVPEGKIMNEALKNASSCSWVSLHLASARYYDLIDSQNNTAEGQCHGSGNDNRSKRGITIAREKMVISKALDWEGIVVTTGESKYGGINSNGSDKPLRSPPSLPIFQSSGAGKLRFRVFEKWSKGTTEGERATFLSARRDIEITLGQRMAVEVDVRSMLRMLDVARAAATEYSDEDNNDDDGDDFVDACEDDDCKTWEDASDDPIQRGDRSSTNTTVQKQQASTTMGDEFSRETYDQIMKQYTEARHLARTRELRGGLLIPSFDGRDDGNGGNVVVGDDTISFDAFFDANDHSVSYYCSMVDEETGKEQRKNKGEKSSRNNMEQTKIEVGLEEFTVKVHIGSSTMEGMRNALSTEQELEPEYILLSMGDLKFIVFGSDEESKVNCSISDFDIESQVTDGHNAIINEPLLRFVDDSDGLLVSSPPPCISMMAELSKADGEIESSRVDVVLQPLEVIYQERAILQLSDVMAQLPSSDDTPSTNESQNDESMNIHVSVSSNSIVLMVPCQNDSKQKLSDSKPNPLFQRHGYKDQGSGATKFSGLGVELDNIAIDLSRKKPNNETQLSTDMEESKAVMTCSHVILFAKGTELERGRRNRKFSSYISRRVDIAAFTGDEDSQSDASLMLSYSNIVQQPQQSTKRKSAFPIILPLSSTKASQEIDESDEDDEIDHLYDDAFKDANGPSGIQSSDPQYVLSSEASEAKRELVVTIPNIFFDSTTSERQGLSTILSNLSLSDCNSESSNKKEKVEPSSAPSTTLLDDNLLGLAINVGQISVVLHGSQQNDSNSYSYSIIMEKMQVHILVGSSGVRNVRFLSHDVTLYELSDFCPTPMVYVRNQCPTSCIERCKRIQERLTKSPSTRARAIFFRQQLCQSLSPETPAMLVDVLLRGDDDFGEMGVHINFYDMTYRYIMKSEWIQNLTALFKGEPEEAPQVEEMPPQEEINVETSSSLINLFVNLADCNIDYTPPQTFRSPSRVFLRMGEIRFTSNIVTPSEVQAYKVSLSDLRLHICNYRHSYNEENSLLSCAHRHLNEEDLIVPDGATCLSTGRHAVGLDDALCRMDFVNVVVLDTLDAVIFKSNKDDRVRKHNDPATTVALTLGKLSIYACHDSFSCLNESYNEWFIKSTALSEEELEKLRESSETLSGAGLDEEISSAEKECLLPLEKQPSTASQSTCKVNTIPKAVREAEATPVSAKMCSASSQQQQHRDDTVSLDLTKSLLFQNYYTFDANATSQAIDPSVGTKEFAVIRNGDNMTLQSSSSEDDCDDDWSTVEHDFLRHSNIPRERDQRAGWVLYDSQKRTKATCKAAQSYKQSQTVKVFPQHIPSKPVLDPFAGGSLDTAKLAGTDAAPNIGTRVIVKDSSIIIRLFDGFDWVTGAPEFHQRKEKPKDRKKQLLSSLIEGDESNGALNAVPLPEEWSKKLQRDIARRKLRRNAHRYFQISIGGLKVKQNSFAESKEHQLASYLDLSVTDFFVAETISTGDPVKMMGEWINESDHPRDNSDGIIMLKMITKRPKLRVSSDGKLMSDESRASLELLPLRCYFNQNALRFIRNFFAGRPSQSEGEDPQDSDDDDDDVVQDDEVINIFFEHFKVRPCKLKVDYQPENMDLDSFRGGNYIEILNLCPLEEMILTLQKVEMQDLTGWGSVFGELAGRWIEDICATQAHKFLTRASPFQPFSNLGDPLADLALVLVVPESGGVSNYFKGIVGGTTKFAGKVALEALSTSAKLTKFAANQLSSKTHSTAGLKRSLPRRPRRVPRHAGDAAGHAYESVATGLREANYKIVTVPLREYQNSGAGGAARSALKGVPIGIIAPIAGASEALSYTLLGLRNQLRPDIRKEEEASLRGLNYD